MAEDPPFTLRLVLRATSEEVRSALGAVTRSLARPPEELQRLELALAEAMNNVVKHAYDARGGCIELAVTSLPDGTLCEVRDSGAAMPGGAPPEGSPPTVDGDPETLPDGGFGWFLIRSLSRDLLYERWAEPPPGQNVLRFRIAPAEGIACRRRQER
ncbi:serine/threonine-protein kinase RsbW [Hasllibacter halocynthiae]|uniref:Serine/threonine-protein kinase RsbW n=1 Tax=Hasllibacter halocynthiae TaxID=595589 RepID=A0A2T0X1F0_9RHOB|nr:ATP-binding protein [Hasllibacter halocynthiae]PRY92760.1 serine/threonine-protein kinase RsbW [Hasllibacter halocynthiae]